MPEIPFYACFVQVWLRTEMLVLCENHTCTRLPVSLNKAVCGHFKPGMEPTSSVNYCVLTAEHSTIYSDFFCKNISWCSWKCIQHMSYWLWSFTFCLERVGHYTCRGGKWLPDLCFLHHTLPLQPSSYQSSFHFVSWQQTSQTLLLVPWPLTSH